GSALNEAMEGRIRVSVVATGIDAEIMAKGTRGNVVQPLWPQARPKTQEMPAAATGTDGGVVHRQMETRDAGVIAADLEDSLPAMLRARESMERQPMELGGMDSPIIMEEPVSAVREMPAQRPMVRPNPAPEREKRRFGLFGGRKREARAEPVTE